MTEDEKGKDYAKEAGKATKKLVAGIGNALGKAKETVSKKLEK